MLWTTIMLYFIPYGGLILYVSVCYLCAETCFWPAICHTTNTANTFFHLKWHCGFAR